MEAAALLLGGLGFFLLVFCDEQSRANLVSCHTVTVSHFGGGAAGSDAGLDNRMRNAAAAAARVTTLSRIAFLNAGQPRQMNDGSFVLSHCPSLQTQALLQQPFLCHLRILATMPGSLKPKILTRCRLWLKQCQAYSCLGAAVDLLQCEFLAVVLRRESHGR